MTPAALHILLRTLIALLCLSIAHAQGGPSMILSLDGEWLLAVDPQNVGRDEGWPKGAVAQAVPARVPWIIQDAFPGYHGVAWYWRQFDCPVSPHSGGRVLLRFEAVDYLAHVWVNGRPVGEHEGGECPFTLDITDTCRQGEENLVAVRVLNPTNEPIDGYVLRQTPARNKVIPYSGGGSYNHGGIVGSVQLVLAPGVRLTDLFARPDPRTGRIAVQATVQNAGAEVKAQVQLIAGPAVAGHTLASTHMALELPGGESVLETELTIAEPRLWQLNDPYLYRVSARVQAEGSADVDETSVRCGFRRFTFERGYFRLNGRRLFLRCSHTGNHCPVGLQFPPDPDMLRRDLLNVKVMGFNAIRFIAGVATEAQLDLCDEIGLLVYEEHYGSWCLEDSPQMAERFDRSLVEMIRRDRNHPSLVIWGLLNETPDGPVFRHAAACLPLVRELDDARMVMLNSGRWDLPDVGQMAGLRLWRTQAGPDPNVSFNPTDHPLSGLGITWPPGQMAFHPGPDGEYSAIRWTAPQSGEYGLSALFRGIAQEATVDVHVLHNGTAVFSELLNLEGRGNECIWEQGLEVAAGDTLDFVVGWGNGSHGADSTGLEVTVRSADGVEDGPRGHIDAAGAIGAPWSFGMLAPGPQPDAASFAPYEVAEELGETDRFGTLSNPGSTGWEPVLGDRHPYPRVPHTAATIEQLRTMGAGDKPLFISEYGIGSGVDLCRVARHYERLGRTELEDARFYRASLDGFLRDWERWRMDECFARPEDFFTAGVEKMAGQRLLGLNALRANPNLVAHSLTGTVDQGMSGEGLFSTFRELKPGTVDAVFEGLAPLRLCLFCEPVQVYLGDTVRLRAVLANEDVLAPGEYAVRVQVVGPGMARLLDEAVTVRIPSVGNGQEPPFALPVLERELEIDGPAGEYRFLGAFEAGGAATGGEAGFWATDRTALPQAPSEVTLWGEDAQLASWLAAHGVTVQSVAKVGPAMGEVILAGGRAPDPADGAVWGKLAERVAGGATAVFLCPEVFRERDSATRWLPLAEKGDLVGLPGWLYHKDEWAKTHAIFEGLPAGGLMDYAYYREIVPDIAFSGQEPPAEAVAGANNVSLGYSSGLLVAVYPFGHGRFVLNTLLVRENLGHPVADRLLVNLLRYAAEGGRH